MVFLCQKNSYLKQCETIVESCCKASRSLSSSGKAKKEVIDGYDVELQDTILFPEGGGQPDDRGTIDNIEVLKVIRSGSKAIHFVKSEIEVGKQVKLEVDWKRRFDHMQQHSGQHLITAIADELFGFKTTSWDLGKSVSFIELDVQKVSDKQIEKIENLANEYIRNRTEVIVHTYSAVSEIPSNIRTRGLPADHEGEIRAIEIKNVDCNMCCGTHVENLADLQIIKLLQVEKGKKGKSNLYFLVGDRVSSFVAIRCKMDKEMNKQLKCGPEQFVESVERMTKQLRISLKNETSLLRDLALLEADKINKEFKESQTRFFSWHKKEGNNEYMNIIAKNSFPEIYLLLTVGNENGSGLFLISGDESFIKENGQKICEILEGKGAAKGRIMQGKASKMKMVQTAIKHFKNCLPSN